MNLKYCLLFLVFIAVLNSCKQEPATPPLIPYHIPQAVKDYMYFKPGTYWIYQDSATKQLDSVVVFNTVLRMDTTYDVNGKYGIYESFAVYSKSYLNDYIYEYRMNTTISVESHKIERVKYKSGDYVGKTVVFGFPFITNKHYYVYNSMLTITAIYESLLIDNKKYERVERINDPYNITEDEKSTNFFVAKNYGIVRKEIIGSSKTWTLIRSNILQ